MRRIMEFLEWVGELACRIKYQVASEIAGTPIGIILAKLMGII